MTGLWQLRAALLVLIGAAVVHAGRYALMPPEHVHAGVHTYLSWAVPAVLVLSLAAIAELGLRARRGRESAVRIPPQDLLTLGFSVAVLTIFGVQETLEGIFSHGQVPVGNVFIADGGWIAFPLSAVAGLLCAVLLDGAQALVRRLSEGPAEQWLPRAGGQQRPPRHHVPSTRALLGLRVAPRGPPS